MRSIIKLEVDSFLTRTRVDMCRNQKCKYSMMNKKRPEAGFYCHFRLIEIDENGKCTEYELLEKER